LMDPDLDLVELCLSFLDVVLHKWRMPRHIAAEAGIPAPLAAQLHDHIAALSVHFPPALLAMGPSASGVQLVEECEGIAALERLWERELSDVSRDARRDETAARLSGLAKVLVDRFYGGNADTIEDDDVEAPSASAALPSPAAAAAAPARGRGAALLPAWMTSSPSS
jgi:hypothetical protein